MPLPKPGTVLKSYRPLYYMLDLNWVSPETLPLKTTFMLLKHPRQPLFAFKMDRWGFRGGRRVMYYLPRFAERIEKPHVLTILYDNKVRSVLLEMDWKRAFKIV